MGKQKEAYFVGDDGLTYFGDKLEIIGQVYDEDLEMWQSIKRSRFFATVVMAPNVEVSDIPVVFNSPWEGTVDPLQGLHCGIIHQDPQWIEQDNGASKQLVRFKVLSIIPPEIVP